MPAAEAKKTKEGLENGQVDIVIGTHALLAKSIKFKRLGLVIVDEEQHFGVVHKERLKALKSDVHVLTLTATPIPRTLQMAMSGLRELSTIQTPPVDRLAVRTYVSPFDGVVLRERPVPALDALTYRLPESLDAPPVGARVLVPVGKRVMTGIVLGVDGDDLAREDAERLGHAQRPPTPASVSIPGKVRGSVTTPVIAEAAAVSGDARNVRPPLPWRPSKLRFDVLTAYWPGNSWSPFIAMHIEQPDSRQSPPAALKMSARPSRSASRFTSSLPGVTISATPSEALDPATVTSTSVSLATGDRAGGEQRAGGHGASVGAPGRARARLWRAQRTRWAARCRRGG